MDRIENTCTKCGIEIKGIGSLLSKIVDGKLVHIKCPEPQPDQSRLLMDEEICHAVGIYYQEGHPYFGDAKYQAVAKAQRDLTAQFFIARIEALIEEERKKIGTIIKHEGINNADVDDLINGKELKATRKGEE